ncbi:hypothetical protein EBA31_06955 [Serratia sp. P2ACOL2]|nr:hypothetical protein EBA31_06955 [Serratia sp. P2ACOL2]
MNVLPPNSNELHLSKLKKGHKLNIVKVVKSTHYWNKEKTITLINIIFLIHQCFSLQNKDSQKILGKKNILNISNPKTKKYTLNSR